MTSQPRDVSGKRILIQWCAWGLGVGAVVCIGILLHGFFGRRDRLGSDQTGAGTETTASVAPDVSESPDSLPIDSAAMSQHPPRSVALHASNSFEVGATQTAPGPPAVAASKSLPFSREKGPSSSRSSPNKRDWNHAESVAHGQGVAEYDERPATEYEMLRAPLKSAQDEFLAKQKELRTALRNADPSQKEEIARQIGEDQDLFLDGQKALRLKQNARRTSGQ